MRSSAFNKTKKLMQLIIGSVLSFSIMPVWATIETVDVLAVYPQSLANQSPLARLANMEQYANKALENGQAEVRFRVVHIEEIDFPDAKTDVATLQSLQKNSDVRALRSKYGADLVIMLTPTYPYCGVGYVPRAYNGQIHSFYKDYGYSIVGHYCTSSFAHELGHNMTLGHSHEQGSTGGMYSWGRGHGVHESFVTTMAYNSAYSSDTKFAPRLQIFSTPHVEGCAGHACGQHKHEVDGADAVHALNEAAKQISQWYESRVAEVNPNAKPSAHDDMATTHIQQPVYIDVLSNDSDPDNDPLYIDQLGLAKHGVAQIDGNQVLYVPEAGFAGQDDFEYAVADGQGNQATASVTVNVGLGLKFDYFEGQWERLDELLLETPKSSGIVHNFSLDQRERDEDYGLRFYGQIDIPVENEYEFFLKSGQSSALFIDGIKVVDNEGVASVSENAGKLVLKRGLHFIELRYIHQQGNPQLSVDWQTPQQARQMLSSIYLRATTPENTFPVAKADEARVESEAQIEIAVLDNDLDPDNDNIFIESVSSPENGDVSIAGDKIVYAPAVGFTGYDEFAYTISDGKGGYDFATVKVSVGKGMVYEYYQGSWDSLPDFDSLEPHKSGVATDFSMKEREQNDLFAFRYTAQIEVPNDGYYFFAVFSDEGSRLKIDDSVVVNNDIPGRSGMRIKARAVKLLAGTHDIEIEYFERYSRERLMVIWGGSGVRFRFMSANDLVLPVK